jgi:hypothetical protein
MKLSGKTSPEIAEESYPRVIQEKKRKITKNGER